MEGSPKHAERVIIAQTEWQIVQFVRPECTVSRPHRFVSIVPLETSVPIPHNPLSIARMAMFQLEVTEIVNCVQQVSTSFHLSLFNKQKLQPF